MLTVQDAVKSEAPPVFRERCVTRCLKASFGTSKSSGNPMLTLEWELVGMPKQDGTLATEVTVDGNTYQIGGLNLRPEYYTLVAGKALNRFFEFQKAVGTYTGEVDEENFDPEPYEGILMQSIVTTEVTEEMRARTKEEIAQGVAPEPILDESGKPITRTALRIGSHLEPYAGNVDSNAY